MAPDIISAAGQAVVGFRITYPDVSPEAMGKGYPKFIKEYKKTYGEPPISGFHANAYDAAELAMKAIEKVAKTDKDGTTYIGRKALRDAVRRPSSTASAADRLRCARRVRRSSSRRSTNTPTPIRRLSRSA